MKLPVRFARILFLRSPGASSRVRAGVLQCNDEFVEGRIGLYDEAGKPCVLVDGFRAISVAGVRRAGAPGGTRDVLYHVDWERTPVHRSAPALPPLPLAQLARRRASQRWTKSSPCAAATELQAAMAAGDDLAAAQLARGLREMGVAAGAKFHRRVAAGRRADATGVRAPDGQRW